MPLRVIGRQSTGAWTISGTVAGQRIRLRPSSNNKRLAEEEAAAIEARLLREAWHGPKAGARTFGEAALSYAEAIPRAAGTLRRLARLVDALGPNTPLAEIDQDAVARARDKLLNPGASQATYTRGIITPLRAVLNHAADLGWCNPPRIKAPRQPEGRTRFLLPAEAECLIAAAAPHLKPLLIFLLCTGARMSEALELEWRDVDLVGGRAIFWQTKSGKRRVATLPPRAIAALAELPHREGHVFRSRSGNPYWSSDRNAGGQIKTAWRGAFKRSGLDPQLTPHDLRHTWASWHYALHKDLLRLKQDGGWSSVELVERYSHLMPEGSAASIQSFLEPPQHTGIGATAVPTYASV
jgi:integrase